MMQVFLWVCLLTSVGLNLFLVRRVFVGSDDGYDHRIIKIGEDGELSWSRRAAQEAEAVAAINCSGHGRAYLDGGFMDGKPVCECNHCYGGHDCSLLDSSADCVADADGGDPLFLEPFWMQHADRSAVLIPGWHRLSYVFPDKTYISKQLETLIRSVHSIAKNAITEDKFIIFGTGSTQLLSAGMIQVFVWVCLLTSAGLNLILVRRVFVGSDDGYDRRIIKIGEEGELSWSRRAAQEAEAVAAINCSGHGRAYLDGGFMDGKPVCECNLCYGGHDCSLFNSSADCVADANSGDPLFLEPFWMQHTERSAVLIPGWHRMSYVFPDKTYISKQLETLIRSVHSITKNAITEDKFIVFGTGSTQLLSAEVFALSMNITNHSSPANVVTQAPSYSMYELQTDYFETARFKFEGNSLSFLNNATDKDVVIEFVASPNNPDGLLREAVIKKHHAMAVYDHAYYWPHYTAIPAPADEDVMIFTVSKLTGHAGSRFGWAFVRDKTIYENMELYIDMAEFGTSRETQLRVLQLLKSLDLRGRNSKGIFQFAYKNMRDRWVKINKIMSLSKRISMQEIPPMFCNFFGKVRGPSPAYAWLKCEREEDSDCTAVLESANIIARRGSAFGTEDRYARLSLLKSQDDFNLLLRQLTELVSKDNETEGRQTM